MEDALWILAALAVVLIAVAGALVMIARLATLIGFGGAPFVASTKDTLARAFRLAGLKPSDRVADLGSGDGLVLVEAIRAGAREAVGYEIDPILVWASRRDIKRKHLENKIQIVHQDFWQADLAGFDIVFLFQIPYAMKRAEEKLRAGLQPGTRVISNSFAFPNWKPEKTDGHIYLYVA